MKKAVITGERQAEVVDAPDPRPKENWALVKVHAAPMCTEYKAWTAGREARFLGHEAAGEVVEVAQPCRVKPGDRVAVMPQYPCGTCELCVAGEYIHCQHSVNFQEFTGGIEGRATYAQYLLKPDWLLPPIPDDVSYEHAGLACCALGPTFGAMQMMRVDAFDTVLVTGLGPVGLGGVVNARFRGARVIAVDNEPFRVERAEAMGAAAVLDPAEPDVAERIKDLTGGKGADCAVDCSGVPAAHRLCMDAVRRKGKVAFVGECGEETPIRVSPDLIRTGIHLIGAWHYNLQDFPKIVQVIQDSPLIELLVSHVLPMSQVQHAFELCAEHQTAKVILKPWE
jgi:threonine dehydrogenase-like Zn-dependent dehydrogenase